jgi:hypothetical protein
MEGKSLTRSQSENIGTYKFILENGVHPVRSGASDIFNHFGLLLSAAGENEKK